jgi:membrane-associated phospholipid phosphatase
VLDALDLAVNSAFAPFHHGLLLTGFAWFTDVGAGVTAVAVGLAASALLWSGGRSRWIAPLWLTLIGAEATTWSLKFAVARLRPAHLEGISAASPSFPSAHATVALALYGYLALAVAAAAPGQCRMTFTCAGIAIALIGFSRIFLSLHYLSDVLAGYAIAAVWLWIGWRMTPRTS